MKPVPSFKGFGGSEVINEAVDLTGVKPIMPNVLPAEIQSILNERLGDEYTAYFFYRNAANWCKNANYAKAAAFFEAELVGELEHSKGIQDYLTQWNLIPQIPQTPTFVDFTSLVDVINKAYTLEYNLLQKYSNDVKNVLSIHPGTFNFLQGYVDIQLGEVAEYSDYLNALTLINTDSKFEILYFENEYFG